MKSKLALIIYHRVDYDGVFSACTAKHELLLKNYKVSLLGYNYGDPLLDLEDLLQKYSLIILVDITLPSDSMIYLYQHYNNKIIWIDHHETAIQDSKINGYNNLPGLRKIGISAAELTWNYFYPNHVVPMIIQYIGAYDVWDQTRFPWDTEVLPIQYALKSSYGVQEFSIWKNFYDGPVSIYDIDIPRLVNRGRPILKYLKNSWKNSIKKFGFEITVAGKYRGIALITTEFSSNIFQSVSKQYDLMCSVNMISPDKFTCSLYVDPDKLPEFSVGKYLKDNYGGGGHKRAAGCQLNLEEFSKLLINRVL